MYLELVCLCGMTKNLDDILVPISGASNFLAKDPSLETAFQRHWNFCAKYLSDSLRCLMTYEYSSTILDESPSSEIMFLKPYKGDFLELSTLCMWGRTLPFHSFTLFFCDLPLLEMCTDPPKTNMWTRSVCGFFLTYIGFYENNCFGSNGCNFHNYFRLDTLTQSHCQTLLVLDVLRMDGM